MNNDKNCPRRGQFTVCWEVSLARDKRYKKKKKPTKQTTKYKNIKQDIGKGENERIIVTRGFYYEIDAYCC